MPRLGAGARFWRAGYDRRSLVVLVSLVGVAALVGYRWSDLLDANDELDGLLAGIWLMLALLVCWRVQWRHDVCLVLTGLVGGTVIETWGTSSGLWSYFTGERPPLWILPAWPVAALAIDRLQVGLDRALRVRQGPPATVERGRYRIVYWAMLTGFLLAMAWFMRPAWEHPATLVVGMVMVLVVLAMRDPRADVLLFAAGSLLGLFLEYWGTSRQCWTYHTAQVPPPVAVAAHGFAALAFARVSRWVEHKLRHLPCRSPRSS